MVSVIACWGGRCPQKDVQLELCKFIERIANISHNYHEEPPEIKRFNHKIKGRIILDPGFVDNSILIQHGIKIEETEVEANIIDQMKGIKTRRVKWPILEEANLFGLEFRLFDPRDLLGGRMSFVFLSHDIPDLDGLLVMVEDHEECQYYKSEIIKKADWYLTIPDIVLRYYLEPWFDYLMGWIKYFFIPDLWYWRYEDMSGYEHLK